MNQYYELTLQNNTKNPSIKDYFTLLEEIQDLWDVTILACFEYGEKHNKLHVHAIVIRDGNVHPIRKANIPHRKGWSISFSKCRSKEAWARYTIKNISNQDKIIDYELSRSTNLSLDIRKLK